jgi:hypothetical protein
MRALAWNKERRVTRIVKVPMLKNTLLALTALLTLATTGLAGFVFLARPLSRPPQAISAAATADRLARGDPRISCDLPGPPQQRL